MEKKRIEAEIVQTTQPKELSVQEKLVQGQSALEEMRVKLKDWSDWWKTQIGWEDQTIDGANQYIPKDFWTNLNDWMYPYLHRLLATEYITTEMLYSFMDECENAMLDLRALANQADWEWEYRQKSFFNKLCWRWKAKRLTKYGYADFRRLSSEDVFVPLL